MDGLIVGIAGVALTFIASGAAVAFSYGTVTQKVSDMSKQIVAMGEGFNGQVKTLEKNLDGRVNTLEKNVTERIKRLEGKIDNNHR